MNMHVIKEKKRLGRTLSEPVSEFNVIICTGLVRDDENSRNEPEKEDGDAKKAW